MGYYTRYELEVKEDERTEVCHEEEICKIIDYEYLFEERVKWYECEKDMRSYSVKYPKTLFMITGEGEESGDLWKAYFKDCKMQMAKAKITYDEYDKDKLS